VQLLKALSGRVAREWGGWAPEAAEEADAQGTPTQSGWSASAAMAVGECAKALGVFLGGDDHLAVDALLLGMR